MFHPVCSVREGLEAALSPSQIYMLPDASAVAYAYCLQRGTGLVVDFGWSSTRVSAFDNFSALSTSFSQQGVRSLRSSCGGVLGRGVTGGRERERGGRGAANLCGR